MTENSIPQNPSVIIPKFNNTAIDILNKRYLIKDEEGNIIETPAEMLWRVAYNIASADGNYTEKNKNTKILKRAIEFYEMMANLEFLPNSPTLMNAGNTLQQLSACVSGDTIVHTVEGEFTIKELCDRYPDPKETFDVYSCDNEKLVIGKAFYPRLTNKDVKLYEITLSTYHNDVKCVSPRSENLGRFNTNVVKDQICKIKVTSDHKLMLRDGSYKSIDGGLKPDDSIMPFNHSYIINSRLVVYENINQNFILATNFTYKQYKDIDIAEQKGYMLHHINLNRDDNRIENLKYVSHKEHCSIHATIDNPMWKDSAKKKISEYMQGNKRACGAVRDEKFRQALSDHNGMKNPVSVDKMVLRRSYKVLEFLEKNNIEITQDNYILYRKKSYQATYIDNLIKSGRVDSFDHLCELYRENYAPNNHKIISIVEVDNEDVYDLSVHKYHNFAANGIFIHNCFCLPISDSMDSIFETLKNTAMIHKSGGGTGFNFSKLRPANDLVNSTKGVSSGPLSFISVFDGATEVISQGGSRRGANMGILRIDHPDIMDFIKVKSDLTKLTNFNLSIAITDVFMEAVKNNTDYDIINPRNKEVVSQFNARKVFKQIIKQAWTSGEPGLIFIDEANRYNPTPQIGEYETTNPCGEQLLLVDHKTGGGESCNLGSINVATCINKYNNIDYEKLMRLVETSVHFLDNVIDVNLFPLPAIEKLTKDTRKIGLGIMGFSDMLLKLGIPYSSNKAVEIANELMSFINKKAYEYSIELGKTRGVYPVYKTPIHIEFNEPCRNAARTTIAPTGTISILANCSSGIEPIFSLAFVRRIMDNNEFFEVNPVFEKVAKENRFYSDKVIKQLADEGTVHNIKEIPENFKKYFESAHDILPHEHIAMQATFQKHVDSSISKTINFSKTATEEDVEKAYLLAYKSKCKGITIYRDGCRQNQVLNIGSEEKQEIVKEKRIKKNRPKLLKGSTYEYMTGCGKIFITINEDSDGNAFEMFSTIGKAGGCASSNCEAIGRLTSLALRSGQTLEPIIKQLSGIRCHMPLGFGDNVVLSCSDAIAQAMKFHFENQEGNHKIEIVDNAGAGGGACPDCGGSVSYESGCQTCHLCGWSACS